MDHALFEAVRQKCLRPMVPPPPLYGKQVRSATGRMLFDDAGHSMIPTHATKLASAIVTTYRRRACRRAKTGVSRVGLPRFPPQT